MNEHVTCPACGTPNSAADAYCGACGTSLRPASVPPLPCWNCRAPNPPGRAYCGQCGQPLAGPAYATLPDDGRSRGGARNPLLIALGIVLMAFLGLAAGFLILTLADQRDAGIAGAEATASPTSLLESPAPEATASPTPRPRRTPRPTPTLGPPGAFVCYESASVNGPAGTDWDLFQVDFRTYRDYDRVIYQLRRTGGSGDAVTPTILVRQQIEGEGEFVGAPPALHPDADSRINVMLANGVRDRTGLDAYEPRGMKVVESLSTMRYRSHVNYANPDDDPAMADIGTLSTIDVLGEGCFALRVVGWDGGRDTASVYVDIQR
jgi:hypothetical protein